MQNYRFGFTNFKRISDLVSDLALKKITWMKSDFMLESQKKSNKKDRQITKKIFAKFFLKMKMKSKRSSEFKGLKN